MDKKFSNSKVCNKCSKNLPIIDFNRDKSKKDGYKNYCKLCQKTYNSNFYLKNRDRIIKYSINYQKDNKEEVSIKNRVKCKLWIKKNKEKKREYDKKYNILNRERIRNQKRKNSDNINKRRRETRSKNTLIRLKNNIRSLIYISIKKRGYSKMSNTSKILDIEYDKFILYIESKFEPWMTWDNYGKYNGDFNYGWDLDHIIPVSSAKSESDIIQLNHYSNFQPLCSKINRDIKKDKLING